MDSVARIRNLKIIFVTSLAMAVLAAGTVGFLLGRTNLNSRRQIAESAQNNFSSADLDLFWRAYVKLKETYLDKVDPEKYLFGAISGGYASVQDAYTLFLDPELSKDFSRELSGEVEGIGIKIGEYNGLPAVIAPLDGSPAQKAGLRPKDQIIKVDDLETQTMNLDEVVAKIRGKAGSQVRLEIMREGQDQPLQFEIQREKIDVKTVEIQYKGDVAIIALNEFGLDTKPEFEKAAQEVANRGISKVVLDLRNNPGGLLDGSVDVMSEFVAPDTTAVIEESKSGKNEHKTSGEPVLKQVKLAVLVNGGTASSSEIVAGAIKDLKRGTIIGEKTFGKGTVQELSELSGGSSAKITVAKWLTPNGKNIDKDGITPDIEVKEPDNILFAENDPLISRAVEELNK